MIAEAEIEVVTRVKLDIELVARWFANLDDDSQARFFVAVAAAAKSWPVDARHAGQWHQWYQVGSHLRNCECSSEDAREMVRHIHDGLETGSH